MTHGLKGDRLPSLEIPSNAKSHRFGERSADVVRLASLAQVITDAVLTDACVVDAGNTGAWRGSPELDLLADAGLVVPRDFTAERESWLPIRESIESKLCFLKSLRREHEKNKKHYRETGESANPMLGTLLWGGAGMLARAQHSGLSYTSHPLRGLLLARAGILLAPPSAARTLNRFLESISVSLAKSADESGYWARIRLPSIFSEVVAESRDMKDIVPVAIQLRDRYAELRGWLAEFQRELDGGDSSGAAARKRTLEGVVAGIDSSLGGVGSNGPTVQLNLGLLRVTYSPRGIVNRAMNWFGVRAQIAQLIKSSTSNRALDRLIGFMGESGSQLGYDFRQQWLDRNDAL